jgi:hypothetical protein
MLRPGIPEKAVKGLSIKKTKGTLRKIIKQDLAKRMGGLITSRPIMFIGI